MERYFDDWYIYCVFNGQTTTYSLFKLREEETETVNNITQTTCPSAAISFVEYQTQPLINLLASTSSGNQQAFENETNRVILSRRTSESSTNDHSVVLQQYFSNAANNGSYLIAEAYVAFIAETSVQPDGTISIPANTVAEDMDRIWNTLNSINQRAGRTIYANNKLYINNANSLDYYEKIAIMITHTGNFNFNSFAAEVKFHADGLAGDGLVTWAMNNLAGHLLDPIASDHFYESCLKSDMAVGEEQFSIAFLNSLTLPYYIENQSIIQTQINYHGDY